VLQRGAPHLYAAMYALLGWFMVMTGTALGVLTLKAALSGTFLALLPLPFAFFSFLLAGYALRCTAEAIRSAMR
jgi:hypothetical protein